MSTMAMPAQEERDSHHILSIMDHFSVENTENSLRSFSIHFDPPLEGNVFPRLGWIYSFDEYDFGVKFRSDRRNSSMPDPNGIIRKNFLEGELFDQFQFDCVNETNRCFFLHLGFALGINPFALQVAFRKLTPILWSRFGEGDLVKEGFESVIKPSVFVDIMALAIWPKYV